MSDLYRDFIDQKADQIINSLGGTITPAVPNELYRDFLDRKFDDVINAVDNVKVKKFTYTGNGSTVNTITFPTKPLAILSIYGVGTALAMMKSMPFMHNESYGVGYVIGTTPINITGYGFEVSWNNELVTLSGPTLPTRVFNTQGQEFTVYYI